MYSAVRRRLVVWLKVAKDRREEFDRWYEEEYIPRFLEQIPGVDRVSRWRAPDGLTYLTIYDLAPDVTPDGIAEVLRSPRRVAEREAWQQWERTALTEFRDGVFEKTFHLETDGA